MKRVNIILNNRFYRYNFFLIQLCEKKRVYCRHNMNHFLDVARIAYILNLENGLGIEKELIYAAALLHDIGKWKQYRLNIPHERAGARIARKILRESGFSISETASITAAIKAHREYAGDEQSLNFLLYKADKLSRKCFCCKRKQSCNWSESLKNKNINY